MTRAKRRWTLLLLALSGGMLLSGGCDVADAVLETIRLAFNIVDVWV